MGIIHSFLTCTFTCYLYSYNKKPRLKFKEKLNINFMGGYVIFYPPDDAKDLQLLMIQLAKLSPKLVIQASELLYYEKSRYAFKRTNCLFELIVIYGPDAIEALQTKWITDLGTLEKL